MMPDTPAPSFRCRAGEPRCDYRGTVDELATHADEAGHRRCIVCTVALADVERQTCGRCTSNVRDDLTGIVAAMTVLERIIGEAAYHGIAWQALTLVSDGSVEGGGPDDHIRFHDPAPTIAILEQHDRDWREEFGHPRPPYHPLGHPDRETPRRLLDNVVAYLRTWHLLAARTHPGFDDYAAAVRELRSTLEHAAGLADVPVKAPASCFDCGGALVRLYTDRGLTDDWTCRLCRGVYDQASYFLALRARRDECEGWVPVRVAASVLRIPTSTLFRWAADGQVAVRVEGGRSLVEWSEVSRLREARAS